jgi:hypothetical protein
MPEQLDLFTSLAPTPFEKGMAASAKAAAKWTPDQVRQVDDAIAACRKFQPEFSADDIWSRLPKGFPVTKGLAARLNAAANRGLIMATDRTRKSARTDDHGHGQRLTIWRSL